LTNWRREKKPLKKHEMKIVEIVSDASLAGQHTVDGRNIPLVILNTQDRPDIDNLVSNHIRYRQGEVETHWARFGRNKKMIGLHMHFFKPTECHILLEFDITTNGILVDLIIGSQALYIQPGKPGDRLANTMESGRIMIEVPSKDFRSEWMKLYKEQMTKYFRVNHKISRRKAEVLADKFIDETKVMRDLRMPK